MSAFRRILPFVLTLIICATLSAQQRDLLSIVGELGAGLEWDPLRDRGVISLGDDRISLAVGLPIAVINYRVDVPIPAPERRDGAVWLGQDAMTAISRALQKDRIARHGRAPADRRSPHRSGHGGEDPGAMGTYMDGKRSIPIREKDVVLKVGLILSQMLQKALPDKQILLTRSDDTYITLENRAQMANNLLGKTNDTMLYISLHANSTFNKASKAKGYEVWYLPPEYKRTLLDPAGQGPLHE